MPIVRNMTIRILERVAELLPKHRIYRVADYRHSGTETLESIEVSEVAFGQKPMVFFVTDR